MRTFRSSGGIEDSASAHLKVISASLGTRRRKRALCVWLDFADDISEIKEVYRYAEPDSGFEHRVVVKWVRLAEMKEELIEVLAAVRKLKRSSKLERRVLRRLRRFGYQDWWERVAHYLRSLFPARKLV